VGATGAAGGLAFTVTAGAAGGAALKSGFAGVVMIFLFIAELVRLVLLEPFRAGHHLRSAQFRVLAL
jgi:hypothetical protein